MQRHHEQRASDAEHRRQVHLGLEGFVRAGHAGDQVEADDGQRKAAEQHREAGDLGRQIGAQPVHGAAQHQLHEPREHGHAGDQRQAALLRGQDADREIHAGERGRHQIAGADAARLEAEQDGAETQHQHAHRHDVLRGLARGLRGVEHQQRQEHADRGGDQQMLQRRHPQHEGRRPLVDAVDEFGRLQRRAAPTPRRVRRRLHATDRVIVQRSPRPAPP